MLTLVYTLLGKKMKLLITGLPVDATADAVKVGMEKYGPVTHAQMIETKTTGEAWAIVEMAITPEQAFNLTQRVNDIWYKGNFIGVRILNH